MEQLKEKQKLSWEGMFYSAQRIDLLIVSISGASLYAILEATKYLAENDRDTDSLLKVAGTFFVLSILINLYSQVMGHKANEKDFLMQEMKIRDYEKPEEDKESIESYDKSAESYSRWTERMNHLSLCLLSAGLLCLLIFYFMTF